MIHEKKLPSPESLLEGSADGFALLDMDCIPVYVNPAALRLMGLICPEPGDFLDSIGSADRDNVKAACVSALGAEGQSFHVDFRAARRRPDPLDASDRPKPAKAAARVEAHIKLHRDDEGRSWFLLNLREMREAARKARIGKSVSGTPQRDGGAIGFGADITESKRLAESLRRSKEQLEAILRAISDAVVVADSGGRVVYANDAAARMLGMPSSQQILDVALEDLALSLAARDERGMPVAWPSPPHREGQNGGNGSEGAESCPSAQGSVLRLPPRSGEPERWVVANTVSVKDSQGLISLVVASAYDFTERKRAEEALHRSEDQLRQSQKMEAVGRLAGGVAHDFNNLLTAINGYSELLMKSMRETDPLRGTVGEIFRAGDRAASLTRQLLTFSRRQVLAKRILDVNQVVAEIRQMLGRLIGEDIRLITVGDPALPTVMADPGQIEQLILNLALNARDAMPTGGILTIETALARMDKGDADTVFAMEPGDYVRLTVSDTGIGMDESVKAHLFEPFFTTKPPGKGTGLGLSTVYGILKTAGGNISVSSEPSKGTRISVYLPAGAPPTAKESGDAAARAAVDLKTAHSQGGRETILLVEDEDMVRRLIGQVLLSNGYNLLEAGSGAAALEVVERNPGVIDLLLTDVVMSGMSGRELSERLAIIRPGLKVLYMSGYTDDAVLRHGVQQNSTAFLSKPFSPGVLIRKIREVIEGVSAPPELHSVASLQ